MRPIESGSPRWPHEHVNTLFAAKGDILNPQERIKYARMAALFGLAKASSYLGLRYEGRAQENTMGFINGEDSRFLANKYDFVNLVGRLGYTAPLQTMVYKRDKLPSRISHARAVFVDEDQEVFCKPLGGSNGRGIQIGLARELPELLKDIKDDCIVQEKVDIQDEYRYVRYQDANGEIWRISYRKMKPVIAGDGSSTVGGLIMSQNIPARSKLVSSVIHSKMLNKVLSKGEKMQLSSIGSRLRGGYERLPEKKTIEALDAFMQRFTADLEAYVGHRLPLLCFDLGIKDASVFEEEYDFEKMKANVVAFECQMPFTTPGYYDNIPSDKLKTKVAFHKAIVRFKSTQNE